MFGKIRWMQYLHLQSSIDYLTIHDGIINAIEKRVCIGYFDFLPSSRLRKHVDLHANTFTEKRRIWVSLSIAFLDFRFYQIDYKANRQFWNRHWNPCLICPLTKIDILISWVHRLIEHEGNNMKNIHQTWSDANDSIFWLQSSNPIPNRMDP